MNSNSYHMSNAYNFIEKQFDSVQSHHPPIYEGLLYHYTDANGLLGILSSQSLWLTNINHLNDPNELGYPRDELRCVLDKYDQHSFSDRTKEFFKKLFDAAHGVQNYHSYYVASFSKNPDKLSQWRAYGDDGSGFSIGLKSSKNSLTSRSEELSENIMVFEVLYDSNLFKDEMEKLINISTQILEGKEINQFITDHYSEEKLIKDFLLCFGKYFILSAMFLKHEAYKEEEEIRVLVRETTSELEGYVETRNRGDRLIQYIVSKLDHTLPLKNIMVGPCASMQSIDSVISLTKKYPCKEKGGISQSEIPYSGRGD